MAMSDNFKKTLMVDKRANQQHLQAVKWALYMRPGYIHFIIRIITLL